MAQKPNAGAEDWREETLARMRALILEADPEMIEERKWRKAVECGWRGFRSGRTTGSSAPGRRTKKVVKLTFARGASIPDPSRLFNSSLEGNTRRAIDIHEGEKVDARAFKALVKAAVAQNGRAGEEGQARASGQAGETPFGRQPADREGGRRRPGAGVHRRDAGLEARHREAPRRAHRAERAQRAQGREVELAILRHRGPGLVPVVPRLHPLRQGDLLPRHVAATAFRPAPARARTCATSTSTKDELDEAQMATWVKQAAALPGWVP